MSEAIQPSARPGDDRLRERGQPIILRFLAMIRVGRSYKVENQVFHVQIESFLEAVEGLFAEWPEVVLVALDGDLYLNGVRLPVNNANLRFHQNLMAELSRRRIAGVRVLQGIAAEDLERFFRLFLRPDLYNGAGLLEACVADGLSRILPAVQVSTDSDDGADPFDPSSFERWSQEGSTLGTGVAPDAPQEEGDGIGSGGGTGAGAGAGTGGDSGNGRRGPRAVVRKAFSLALGGTRSLLTTTALHSGMQMRHAKRVVQPLIDGAFSGEPIVVGLSSLGHHDEYTYAHAVNVCGVAVTIGHLLGLDRRALADLGVAALLHDVGKAAVYDRVRHALEEMGEEELRIAETHSLEGAKLIARSTSLNPSTLRSIRVALEHHAPDPAAPDHSTGYPALPAGWTTSRLSAIVAVADCYVSLQMHRSPRARHVTPSEALGMVVGPLAPRFDPVILWALVRSIGFYPPGQLVELSDGSLAVVISPDAADPARPNVRVVMDPSGVPFSAVEARELRPLPPDLSVRRALAGKEYPEVRLAA
jgi:HD-GYP domain-containing protein (c-di-GMP phosphodiesterase class II)